MGQSRRGKRPQAGFTTVELIVALAVGTLVAIAIFPIFGLIARVDAVWSAAAQARAAGVTADAALESDLRAYTVTSAGSGLLVLQGAARAANFSSRQPSTFCVSYTVVSAGASLPRLVRSVYTPGVGGRRAIISANTTVAHGVTSFVASVTPSGAQHQMVSVALTVWTLDGPPVAITPVVVAQRENLNGLNQQC